jgi:hypothetical protein
MSRNHPYGQVLILSDHSLDTRKRRSYKKSPVSQLADEHARYNSMEAEIMGGQGSFTGSNATVWVVSTHHGISLLIINPILWDSNGNCRVSQQSTAVTFSDLIVPVSLLL